MNLLSPLSRLLISGIFILSGFNKITHFDDTAKFMGGPLHFPAPTLFLVLAILLELLGGIGLLLGFKTRLSTLALMVFLLAATVFVHGQLLQLAGSDPMKAQDQMINIMKNLAILGGLLKFYLDGPGPAAVDAPRSSAPSFSGR
jgi:putative oxidoreductase